MRFGKSKDNSSENHFWISFSDLMTGLMLVFIIMSIVFMLIAQSKANEVEQMKKNIIVILHNELGKKGIEVEKNIEKGTIEVSEKILFDEGKDILKEKGREFLTLFSTVLDKNIFNNKNYTGLIKYIHIEGHASKKGSKIYNFNLSYNRSRNTWIYINKLHLDNTKIIEAKLNIVSRGEIEANQQIDSSKDRRVVFRFEFLDDYWKLLKVVQ